MCGGAPSSVINIGGFDTRPAAFSTLLTKGRAVCGRGVVRSRQARAVN
jgi:hypothetical protein